MKEAGNGKLDRIKEYNYIEQGLHNQMSQFEAKTTVWNIKKVGNKMREENWTRLAVGIKRLKWVSKIE